MGLRRHFILSLLTHPYNRVGLDKIDYAIEISINPSLLSPKPHNTNFHI